MDRRKFLQGGLALGGAGVFGSLSGCKSEAPENKALQGLQKFKAGDKLPWVNWAANQYCTPSWRTAPSDEDQLVSAIKSAKGVVRAVGSGHSFSAVVPTNDSLISTDLLSGLVSHDQQLSRATFKSGTRLNAIGPLLSSVGQALPNMPDMEYPALGGSIANSVHGTGNQFGSMSSYVTGLRLVTPSGEVMECSAEKNREVFQAARTSVGGLGIVSEITLQNKPDYNVTEISKIEVLEDVLAEMDQRCREHRHFEIFPLPYSSLCISVATDYAKPSDMAKGEDDPQAVNQLRSLFDGLSWLPLVGEAAYDKALTTLMADTAETIRTGSAYQVFPHDRIVRFREMEYTVPAEAGPSCLREVLAVIKDKELPICFPLEYRYVKEDDIWLSMFEGQAGCSISVHQFGDLDYQVPFAEIEPIFWKYQGRPHWGKLHTLDAKRLAPLYSRHWKDFQEVRQSLDPDQKMMNAHLRQLFIS